jgi:hypothetical protein
MPALQAGSVAMSPRDIFDLPQLHADVRGKTSLSPAPLVELARREPEPRSSQRRKTKIVPRKPSEPEPEVTKIESSSDVRRVRSNKWVSLGAALALLSVAGLGFWLTSQQVTNQGVANAAPPPSEPRLAGMEAAAGPVQADLQPKASSRVPDPTAADSAPRATKPRRTRRSALPPRAPGAVVFEENPYGVR